MVKTKIGNAMSETESRPSCRRTRKPDADRGTDEEIQALRRAVGRLDQLLADAAADEQARRKRAKEEEAQALRVAAARLDQLLTDIARKETAPELKLRHLRKK
jgi:hypothetical protein